LTGYVSMTFITESEVFIKKNNLSTMTGIDQAGHLLRTRLSMHKVWPGVRLVQPELMAGLFARSVDTRIPTAFCDHFACITE